jgi:hypothetical protein
MRNLLVTVLAGVFLVGTAAAQRLPGLPAETADEQRLEIGGVTAPLVSPLPVAVGQTLYGVGLDLGFGGSSFLYRIDNYGSSPQAHIIGDTDELLFDLAIDPTTGRFYGVSPDGDLYELNPDTGHATSVGFTGRFDLNALEFDGNGQAWAWGGGDLYRVDKEAAVADRVGSTGFLSGGDLAFDTNGTFYGTTDNQLIRIDKNTGAGTLIGALGFSGAFGLEADSDGTLYAGRGSLSSGLAQLYRVNKTTGAATFLGSISGAGSYGLAGLAFAGAAPAQALFLRNGRFKVEATWRLSNGTAGDGKPVQLTADTGYFWFFAASNVEAVIKVLDGCELNNRFWVFAGGLTNVRVDLKVTDTLRGTTRTYTNPQGLAFQPIQDTNAFTTCP